MLDDRVAVGQRSTTHSNTARSGTSTGDSPQTAALSSVSSSPQNKPVVITARAICAGSYSGSADWREDGWPKLMKREPSADDLIIPSREGNHRSVNHMLKKFRKDCGKLRMPQRRSTMPGARLCLLHGRAARILM